MTHSAWYTRCRIAQEAWKATTDWLPPAARLPGTCFVEQDGRRVEVGPFPICLPAAYGNCNLLPSLRSSAVERFAKHDIQWHHYVDGPNCECWPSTHLLDSQVQCVNTLLSLASDPDALLAVVRTIEPDACDLVIVEDDSPIAFEWIGNADYLGEARGRRRHRGRYVTSADALIVAQRPTGRTGILIEWKFTESYRDPVPFVSPRGTDRRRVYAALFNGPSSPFISGLEIDAFFHEPHYQLMRQHLLAEEMVAARELGIDRALVVFVSSPHNDALNNCIPGGLVGYGASVPTVWNAVVCGGSIGFAHVPSNTLVMSSAELRQRYGAPEADA